MTKKINSIKEAQKKAVQKRLNEASLNEPKEIFSLLNTGLNGMNESQIEESRDKYGENIITYGKKEPLWKKVFKAFADPFTVILLALAAFSFFTDYLLAQPDEKSLAAVLIIGAIILLSGSLRFVQELRSGNAAEKLTKMIKTTTCVIRQENGKQEILLEEVAVGDIVSLSAGDLVPADLRIIYAKDLFISQSALTGESEPVEKNPVIEEGLSITERSNLAFMGTNAISGTAQGIVIAVGNDTLFGSMAEELSEKPPKTSFEKGVSSVSWVLIRFMLVMVPFVFLTNGITKGNWMAAALFAISVAVGLTPEMLPMLVTTCLAKGAVSMSKQKVIIKNLNAIQSLGSMDILCTDKTGTLTQDQVVLEYHLNIMGQEDVRVLRHAFLNSYYQTGLKNLIDVAIIQKLKEEAKKNPILMNLDTQFVKVDEIPFDFERRRMTVVVQDQHGKTQMITKGAVEEMLNVSAYAEYNGRIEPLTEELKKIILAKADELNAQGMRVIAAAQKTNPAPAGEFSVQDEKDMVLIGYLAFYDPPKPTTQAAIEALNSYGVAVKILTGDNEKVTACICRQVGLEADTLLLGSDIEEMEDAELAIKAETTTIFAKLSPSQKARIVRLLKENGHSVGYMGDGINDAAAMKASDAGISVDTAVDIAKESAHVILLEKDLMVLEQGVIEGRKTYANMIKYIKMTASSNFGNMFSVLAASVFLPFLPMASLQLILLNLIYDISCVAIPWDHVDEEFLKEPRQWNASSVSKFMLWMGPVSSVFDIVTYLFLYFVLCPLMTGGLLYHQLADPAQMALYIAIFQTGWFVQSMWSQTLVIHMIRTPKIPFLQSHASKMMTLFSFGAMLAATLLPFSPLSSALGMTALPYSYFVFLVIVTAAYMVLATIMKKLYIRKYKVLL